MRSGGIPGASISTTGTFPPRGTTGGDGLARAIARSAGQIQHKVCEIYKSADSTEDEKVQDKGGERETELPVQGISAAKIVNFLEKNYCFTFENSLNKLFSIYCLISNSRGRKSR